jgi:serine/threonine protein kinase
MMSPSTLPDGFSICKDGTKTIIVKQDYERRLLEQGIAAPENLVSLFQGEGSTHTGRGIIQSIPIRGLAGERMVIRKYLRGGLLRFLNRDIYWGSERPLKELCIGVGATLEGIPTAEILAVVTVNVAGPFYRGYIISKELSSCKDLADFLDTIAKDAKKSMLRQKREVLDKVAKLVHSMHDKGFYHGDLNLKNFLVDVTDDKKVYIIDWDKSCLKKSLSDAARRRNILRLCRSMEKLGRQGLPVTERDQLFLIDTYWQEDKRTKKRSRKDFIYLRISLIMRRWWWRVGKLMRNGL